MKILILVTTYNRPNDLLNLLADLKNDELVNSTHLLVFDDGSTLDYSGVVAFLKRNFSFDYFKNQVNGGKNNYWQIVNSAFNEIRNHTFDYFIMVPDDVRLVDNFLLKALQAYDDIADPKKACLNIWNDYSRFGKQSWTSVPTQRVVFDGVQYHKTGWIDMCFVATERFFEIINYSIKKVEPMYLVNKELSSGVGSQLSKSVINAKFTIYQVIKSLVKHNHHLSVMHPEHRLKIPLITNHEYVTASMAAIPTRVDSLRDTVLSILPQVDNLRIYLNNWNYVPEYLNNIKITIFQSQECDGDLGDAGKFYRAEQIQEGYHLTIDDDIIYPIDYVKTIIENIERLHRKCIVSFHGRKFNHKPVKSYYHSAEIKISCLKDFGNDFIIDCPGTGVMGYHTDTVRFSINDFPITNMADVWAGKKAKENKIKVICLKHRGGWIKPSRKVIDNETIYYNVNRNDSVQTEVVNSFL